MRESLIYDDLERYIQIDIDDVFVGTSGTRMIKADVDALLQSQYRLRQDITNFTYSLGFSGYYFRNGDFLEDEGDERLIGMISRVQFQSHSCLKCSMRNAFVSFQKLANIFFGSLTCGSTITHTSIMKHI